MNANNKSNQQMVSPANAASLITQPTVKPKAAQSPISLVSVTTKVTEKSDIWWRYSWIIKVKNTSVKNVLVDAKIEFTDQDGFVIDDDTEYKVNINANTTTTVTGYALVALPGASAIKQPVAKVRMR